MNYREAILEAHRRIEPNTDATALLRFAEVHVATANTSREIPQGKEEAFIQELLAINKQFEALSPAQLADLRSMIASGPSRN